MISICIPVFNYNVTSLHSQLLAQISDVNKHTCDIIIIDDHSEEEFRKVNREVCKDDIYIELPENAGRSGIRNLFSGISSKKYLLFIDCDSIVDNPEFLEKYLDYIKQAPQVVCGGSIYTKDPPERERMLRWKYGTSRESKPARKRIEDPYRSFMANNFLIEREIFSRIRFDERLKGYGYEDTLFGYSLRKAGIRIDHIDNPVVNGGLENNTDYLARTDEAMSNLVEIMRSGKFNDEITEFISLLTFFKKVKKYSRGISIAFSLLRPMIVKMLSKGYANLRLYDLYKLGTFNHLLQIP
jgi:glycosyltransferase involved in cell wall biosynthesis